VLLLETPVALLDEVQHATTAANAAAHVRVAPQFTRPQAQAPRTISPGLRYWVERREQPRPMMIHVLEMDLRQLGEFEFVTTPTDSTKSTASFSAEKTSQFATRQGLIAAVNASYFLPFDGGRLLTKPYVPQAGQTTTASEAVLPNEDFLAEYRSTEPRVDAVVCLHPKGFTMSRTRCPVGSHVAFAAGPMLLEHGEPRPLWVSQGSDQLSEGTAKYYRTPQPRTALGVDAATHRVWMVVVDGRQNGYSEGITLPELATLLQTLGAHDSLNLDGGGSSTLALQGHVVNSPIHTAIPGRERPVANHFGLRLTTKENGLAMPASASSTP
jgi:hypothetical protein